MTIVKVFKWDGITQVGRNTSDEFFQEKNKYFSRREQK